MGARFSALKVIQSSPMKQSMISMWVRDLFSEAFYKGNCDRILRLKHPLCHMRVITG